LNKRAKNGHWQRRYFILDSDGTLKYTEKKGGVCKVAMIMGQHTQVNRLVESGRAGGFSVMGSTHKPYYLQADHAEVAEGWMQALNILKRKDNSAVLTPKAEKTKDDTMRRAFATKNVIQKSRGRKKQRGTGFFDVEDMPPPPGLEATSSDSGQAFTDGFMLSIDGKDYFVDCIGWEYYAHRGDFLDGRKPVGLATLELVV